MDCAGDDDSGTGGRCSCCDLYMPSSDSTGFFRNISVCALQDAVGSTNSEVPLVRLKAVTIAVLVFTWAVS